MGELLNIKHELDEIDQRSHILIEEFENHYSEVVTQYPEAAEKREEIFQSWTIQKIAGIHLSIEKLAEHIKSITTNK